MTFNNFFYCFIVSSSSFSYGMNAILCHPMKSFNVFCMSDESLFEKIQLFLRKRTRVVVRFLSIIYITTKKALKFFRLSSCTPRIPFNVLFISYCNKNTKKKNKLEDIYIFFSIFKCSKIFFVRYMF